MESKARGYLADLARRLKLDPRQKQEILRELESHVEDQVQALRESGLDEDEALRQSLKGLGEPDILARHYYTVHSPAPWSHVLLAALPHLLFSMLFAMHLWTASLWVALLLVSMTAITVMAWRKGQPDWLYPWLGYSLIPPVIAGGLAVLALSYGLWDIVRLNPPSLPILAYMGLAVLLPLVYVVVKSIWSRVIHRDWLYASLAALPFPFVASWLGFLESNGGVFAYDSRRLEAVDGATALLFFGLFLTTAVVLRVGARTARIATLALATPLLILLGAFSYEGSVFTGSVFLLLVLALAIMVLPAVVDAKQDGHGPHRPA